MNDAWALDVAPRLATPGPTAPPSTTATVPALACPDAIVAPPPLYDPKPGSTGVPTTEGRLIVGSPSDGTFRLQIGPGTPVTIGPVSPAPSPARAPSRRERRRTRSRCRTLASGTTYTVEYVGNDPDASCPHEESGAIGTLTTK